MSLVFSFFWDIVYFHCNTTGPDSHIMLGALMLVLSY